MKRLPHGVFSTRICASNYFASVKPIRKAAASTKNKAAGLPPYRLMFIFSQRRRHGCHRAFFLPELCVKSLRQCELIPIMQFYPKSCYIHEKQSGRASTIPLNVYFFPTQTARLPQGVFSTRICASNRSANADTWEIIPIMQS